MTLPPVPAERWSIRFTRLCTHENCGFASGFLKNKQRGDTAARIIENELSLLSKAYTKTQIAESQLTDQCGTTQPQFSISVDGHAADADVREIPLAPTCWKPLLRSRGARYSWYRTSSRDQKSPIFERTLRAQLVSLEQTMRRYFDRGRHMEGSYLRRTRAIDPK